MSRNSMNIAEPSHSRTESASGGCTTQCFVIQSLATERHRTSLLLNSQHHRMCELKTNRSFLNKKSLVTYPLLRSSSSATPRWRRQRRPSAQLNSGLRAGQNRAHDRVLGRQPVSRVKPIGEAQHGGIPTQKMEAVYDRNLYGRVRDANSYFVSDNLRDDVDIRVAFPFETHARRIYSCLILLPVRTVGLAMRDRYAAGVAMWSEIAHSFVGLFHFPHHEAVAFSLHLVYCMLVLKP